MGMAASNVLLIKYCQKYTIKMKKCILRFVRVVPPRNFKWLSSTNGQYRYIYIYIYMNKEHTKHLLTEKFT